MITTDLYWLRTNIIVQFTFYHQVGFMKRYAFFISDEDEVYELNNDSIHFITKDKGENTFKKRIKVVELNANREEDDIIAVIVDNDNITTEEDIIIDKEKK